MVLPESPNCTEAASPCVQTRFCFDEVRSRFSESECCRSRSVQVLARVRVLVLMAELHQTPASLCCCRKSLPVPRAQGSWESEHASLGPRGTGPACSGTDPGPGSPRRPRVDVASASNFRSFRLQHFHLDLQLNFAAKEMSGWLVLDLVPVQLGISTLVLDSHPSLLIHSVDCKRPQEEPVSLTYRVDPFTDYGSSLSISLPDTEPGKKIQISVRYTTTDGPAVRTLCVCAGRVWRTLFVGSESLGVLMEIQTGSV